MIVERIVELCGQKGISIRKLEMETDIGNGTIARWNNSSPTIGSLKKVADYFGVTIDSFFGTDDKSA